MFVVELDAKHRAGQHRCDATFDFYVLVIHGGGAAIGTNRKKQGRSSIFTGLRLKL
jgi:hypothetical protein